MKHVWVRRLQMMGCGCVGCTGWGVGACGAYHGVWGCVVHTMRCGGAWCTKWIARCGVHKLNVCMKGGT